MTEYQKHKAQKKAAIIKLAIMFIIAQKDFAILPNINNLIKLKQIFIRFHIVNSQPIMSNNFKPGGYCVKINS
jgi:hypothetical protein